MHLLSKPNRCARGRAPLEAFWWRAASYVLAWLTLALVGCAQRPEASPAAYVVPMEGPQEVVETFLRLVDHDALDAEAVARLVAIDELIVALELPDTTMLTPEQRRARGTDALLAVFRGDGPMRQLLIQGARVYGRTVVEGGTATVEVFQQIPGSAGVRQGMELELVDGRWRIRRFLDPRELGAVGAPAQ